jgi:hypothetical protein
VGSSEWLIVPSRPDLLVEEAGGTAGIERSKTNKHQYYVHCVCMWSTRVENGSSVGGLSA